MQIATVEAPHRFVSVGGGAGDRELATRLDNKLGRRSMAEITSIDCNPSHVWKPSIHKVAAGSLKPPDAALEYLRHRAGNHKRKRGILPRPQGKQLLKNTHRAYGCRVMLGKFSTVTGANFSDRHNRRFFITLDGVPEEVDLEVLSSVSRTGQTGLRPLANQPGDVVATMPGNIAAILVREGDRVKPGDGLLVTEAMKMESEIQAPISGSITRIHVRKGDRVNPNEVLMEIEAS